MPTPPTWSAPGAAVGLALPLYIVTMASQNFPGAAVLAAGEGAAAFWALVGGLMVRAVLRRPERGWATGVRRARASGPRGQVP